MVKLEQSTVARNELQKNATQLLGNSTPFLANSHTLSGVTQLAASMDLHNFNNNLHSNITLPSATTTPATSTYFTYSIPGMDITPGPVAFTYVSEFLSLITPAELPLGKFVGAVCMYLCVITGSE